MDQHPYKNLDGKHIIGGPLTGWQHSDAIRQTKCPKCQSNPGYHCQTPKGRKALEPHMERLRKFNKWSGGEP